MLLIVVETLIWEVLGVAIHLLGVDLSADFTFGVVIYEVIVHEIVVIKDLHKDKVIRNEGTSAERIRESFNRHCEVVDTQCLVDVEFSLGYLFRCSGCLTEYSELKVSIVDVVDGIEISLGVLFYFLKLDETCFRTTNLFIECFGI